MKRIALNTILLSFLLAMFVSPALAITITDGTFNNSDWSTTKVADTTPNNDASSNNYQASGGLPGEYRVTEHYWQVSGPNSVTIAFAHIYNPFSYDLATQGTLESVSYSFDAILSWDSPEWTQTRGYFFLIEQNSNYYVSQRTYADLNAGWQDVEGTLTADQFNLYGGSGNPDFSSTGAPLSFGYMTDNGGSYWAGTIWLSSGGGVDNFSFTTNAAPIPEPATMLLLGSGLVGLAGFRRKKNK